MWDLAMHPSLTEVVVDNPNLFFLLVMIFVAVVGLAAALMVLEMVQHRGDRKSRAETAGAPQKKGGAL